MHGSPGRKLRRRMEAAIIKASRSSIAAAAALQLKRDRADFLARQVATASEAALQAGRNEKLDPKEKTVRSGPRELE